MATLSLPPVGRGWVQLKKVGHLRLLEADSELGRHLSERERRFAERVVVTPAALLETGRWLPAEEESCSTLGFGLLLLDGLVSRRVVLGARHSVELLGRGDVLRPQHSECDEYALVPSESDWRVLEPTTFAVIDEDVLAGLAGLAGVVSELSGRLLVRSRTLAVRLAIAQVPGLDRRLELLFWHLADRWGKTHRNGVLLPLRLSQATIADLVCAARSSVNAALGRLARQGLMEAHPGRGWLLLGGPPAGAGSR